MLYDEITAWSGPAVELAWSWVELTGLGLGTCGLVNVPDRLT